MQQDHHRPAQGQPLRGEAAGQWRSARHVPFLSASRAYFASQLFQNYSRGAVRNSPRRVRRARQGRVPDLTLPTSSLKDVGCGRRWLWLRVHLELRSPGSSLFTLHHQPGRAAKATWLRGRRRTRSPGEHLPRSGSPCGGERGPSTTADRLRCPLLRAAAWPPARSCTELVLGVVTTGSAVHCSPPP